MSGRRSIEGRAKPDILDCISSLSSDEVFTPPALARKMLNLLPAEVWTNPDLKWLDPATKSGVFLREIARRLMDTLSDAIPDEEERRTHIYKNMLYGLPTTELTSLIARRSVYYTKDADSERFAVVRMGSEQGNIPWVDAKHTFVHGSCEECGAPESLERGEARENYAYSFIHQNAYPQEFKDMKFDVVVGNPPYQIADGGHGASASPVYQKFVEMAIDMAPQYVLMITPSRWFAGGKGLDRFRERMLHDDRMKRIVDYQDATECFPGVEIKGGVNFFLWSGSHHGPCEVTQVSKGAQVSSAVRYLGTSDVFVRSNDAISILDKVLASAEPTMDESVSSRKPFGFSTDFRDFVSVPGHDRVSIFARGLTGWVARDKILIHQDWIDRHKVLVSTSYNGGDHVPHQIIGAPVYAGPGTCCTETYLVCGDFDTQDEAENLAAYLRTRVCRFLVSLRKNTQHNTRDRFAFVPALDMTITWTDEMLYARYSLTPDEIAFIESQIKEMP